MERKKLIKIVSFVFLGLLGALFLLFLFLNSGGWEQIVGLKEERVVSPLSSKNLVAEFFSDFKTSTTQTKQAAEEKKQIEDQVKGNTAVNSLEPKVYFVPLGSATVKSFDWVDTGAQVYLDPKDFPGATITWEASFKIPTANGRIYARLINVNENVQIWGSEIWSEGNTFKLISSGPINLWQGLKLYQVQVKTTMDFEAVMEGARIKISY